MNSRALSLGLLFAIVAVVAFGGWLVKSREKRPVASQCERACAMGCQRDLECGGAPMDCYSVCSRQCQGAADRPFDTKQCLQRIKSLSCPDASRLALGDTSMLSGACGVP